MQKKIWKKSKRQRRKERNRGLAVLVLGIPLEMRRYLKSESQRLNISVNKIIANCLVEYLDKYRNRSGE